MHSEHSFWRSSVIHQLMCCVILIHMLTIMYLLISIVKSIDFAVKIYVQWNDRMNFKIRTTKDKPNYWWLMTLIKRKNIHPIFKCWDLATHITQSTRSTQWAQTSLAEADHYSHMPTVKILRLGGERLPPSKKKKKKKKKSFGSLPLPQSGYATTIMVFFAHLFLLIYSSQKVPTSLKFYRALHILVLHMHRKFDVDSIDSFWDTEDQSTQLTRRKERKKERRKKERKNNRE